jgi:putative membrane protein
MFGWGFFGLGHLLGFLGIFGIFFKLLLTAGVIVGIVFLVRWAASRSAGMPRGDSSLDILNRRYANGEISREEYEEKKRDLS